MLRTILLASIVGAAIGSPAALADPGPAPQAVAPKTDLARHPGDLSDKLNATNGVIHPEGAIDPAMRKPAPATGATPVIRPPAAPGAEAK